MSLIGQLLQAAYKLKSVPYWCMIGHYQSLKDRRIQSVFLYKPVVAESLLSYSSGKDEVFVMQLRALLMVALLSLAAVRSFASSSPVAVKLWPGSPPDETEVGNIGPERVRSSPKLERKQVEVTESTTLITAVTNPTLTIYSPARKKNAGTAILICPGGEVDKVDCRPDFAVPVYSGYLKEKNKDEVASGLRIPLHTPPVFLVHGGEDIISPPEHSVLMYLALRRAGISAELHVYANTTHDFGVRTNQRPYSKWTVACADWLRDNGFLPMNPRGIKIGGVEQTQPR